MFWFCHDTSIFFQSCPTGDAMFCHATHVMPYQLMFCHPCHIISQLFLVFQTQTIFYCLVGFPGAPSAIKISKVCINVVWNQFTPLSRISTSLPSPLLSLELLLRMIKGEEIHLLLLLHFESQLTRLKKDKEIFKLKCYLCITIFLHFSSSYGPATQVRWLQGEKFLHPCVGQW